LVFAIIFGLVVYFIIFNTVLNDLLIDFLETSTMDSIFIQIMLNFIIFFICQCPSLLIYYNYKLKIRLLTEIEPSYSNEDSIEIEIEVCDKTEFIFIDVYLKVDWADKYEVKQVGSSFIILLETKNLYGINNLRIKASKEGYFDTTLEKEIIIL